MTMQILLIGGFDIARTLAASLLKRKYQVAAVHPDYGCCKQLADIKGLQVIHGDGAKPFILEEAGARPRRIRSSGKSACPARSSWAASCARIRR